MKQITILVALIILCAGCVTVNRSSVIQHPYIVSTDTSEITATRPTYEKKIWKAWYDEERNVFVFEKVNHEPGTIDGNSLSVSPWIVSGPDIIRGDTVYWGEEIGITPDTSHSEYGWKGISGFKCDPGVMLGHGETNMPDSLKIGEWGITRKSRRFFEEYPMPPEMYIIKP